MKIRLYLILFSLLYSMHAFSGVDITLRFHYNEYPLCYWEVQLKEGERLLGSGITNKNGQVSYKDITLSGNVVEAYLYQLPRTENDKYRAQGAIALEPDNTGSLDFGPILTQSNSSKSSFEEAWNLNLRDCNEPRTDSKPVSSENIKSEKKRAEAVEVGANLLVEGHHQRQIDSLTEALSGIDHKSEALNQAGIPADKWGHKIYKALINELDAKKKWLDMRLRLANTLAHGDDPLAMQAEIKALKDRYESLKAKREKLQHSARAAVVEKYDEKGVANPYSDKIAALKRERAEKSRAIQIEQSSQNPDEKRIVELKGQIEKLDRKIADLTQ